MTNDDDDNHDDGDAGPHGDYLVWVWRGDGCYRRARERAYLPWNGAFLLQRCALGCVCDDVVQYGYELTRECFRKCPSYASPSCLKMALRYAKSLTVIVSRPSPVTFECLWLLGKQGVAAPRRSCVP